MDCKALVRDGPGGFVWGSKAGLCVYLSEGVTGLVDCKALGVTGPVVVAVVLKGWLMCSSV